MDNQREMSENEYFETKLSDFTRSSHRKFKQIRDHVATLFPERQLLAMASPL